MMWMMVWMIVFWTGVIVGGLWFLVSWRGKRVGDDALDVLRTRLANGDIDVREFEERKAALHHSNRRTAPASLIAVFLAIALIMTVPTVIMAANGWDMGMWDMHGRGQDSTDDPAVRGGSNENVRIEDFAFEPGNLEVTVGATVTWTNEDSVPHDATSTDGEWETSRLSKDESDTLTFGSAGTYDYYCSIHPSMKARLVVR
jgi:plastocyanin